MTPIQLDPNHSVNTVSDSTLAQAQANTRFALGEQVDTVNASRVAEYETQWKAYVVGRDAHPDATNLIVPVPARAEAVFTDERGWPYVDASNMPVVSPHTYVPAVKTQGGFFVAGSGADANKPDVASLLMGAKLYGEPIVYSGMKFLRVA